MRSRLLLLMTCLLGAGCAAEQEVTTVPSGRDVGRELRELVDAAPQPVWFAGRRAEGLPLTAADYDAQARQGVFSYGTCTISLPADGGCRIPLSIDFFPFRPAQWRRASRCVGVGQLRGVPAVRHRGGLALITRHGVITIYAYPPASARRVVAALRPVRSTEAGGRLPPPPAAWARLLDTVC